MFIFRIMILVYDEMVIIIMGLFANFYGILYSMNKNNKIGLEI